MIKAIVVALLAISATRQACDVGCLKCNASGDCLIPDILNSYYLNGTTATKVSLTNCTLNSFDGKCVSCSSGYYLDAATNKCVAVATSGLITNCASYSSATSCSSCNSTYYLSNNACVAVESRISNCDIYSGASVCATCASGYLLSLDNKSCVTAPTISNCGNFTFVKCNTCDSGYVLYLSALLTRLLSLRSHSASATARAKVSPKMLVRFKAQPIVVCSTREPTPAPSALPATTWRQQLPNALFSPMSPLRTV